MRIEVCTNDHGEDALVVTARAVWRKAREVGGRLSLWIQEALACRQCGRSASPWGRVCPHCGTGNPVKIHVSPQLMFTAVACEIVLLYLNLRLG